ncbi:hypothetical protein [Bacillus infantis]|uniref:hypothetical protein n=1 Tax=Bacillus infantis TaxID=324767 RepID=UPI002155EC06|nr:hypothetical protein [Bacillus infantis]MCR6609459.1 hypothetical protein [Bacillus infantis]
MKKKLKSVLVAATLATSISVVVPQAASADSPYSTTLGPLQSKYIAEEVIWADATVSGNQQPVYSGGKCGVEYSAVNSAGATVDRGMRYGIGEFDLALDINGLGVKIRLKAKNVYADLVNTVKIFGDWLD